MKTFSQQIAEAAEKIRVEKELDRIEPTLQAWHEELCARKQAVTNAMIARADGHDAPGTGLDLRRELVQLAAVALLITRQIETEDARDAAAAEPAAGEGER